MITPGPAEIWRHLYRIESRAEAEAASRQGGAILLMLGVVLLASLPWIYGATSTVRATGALLFLVIGVLVFVRHSRSAAGLAFVLACVAALTVFQTVPSLEYWVGADARVATLHAVYVLAFGGAIRSIQGTFLLYGRYRVTRINWPKLIRLWIVVFLYTLVSFWGTAGLAMLTDSSDTKLVLQSFSVGAVVFVLGSLRWLPFTRKLAVLKNETDDLDAMPF